MKRLSILYLALVVTRMLWADMPTVSVSDVSFMPCVTTHDTITVSLLPSQTWHDYRFLESGDYVRRIENSLGCDSLVLLHVTVEHGTLPGLFSISATQKVHFSSGNLQYCAAPVSGPTTHAVKGGGMEQGIWRFAPNQWEICGPDCMTNTSAYYSGWVDYFGYGASGYQGVMPYETSTDQTKYPATDIEGTNYDWGIYNAISNGGNQPGIWFSPSRAQWQYLLETRPNATALRGAATVHGVRGIVLLPDDWTMPVDIVFNRNQTYYAQNIITDTDWAIMEEAGAVFLPVTSARDQTASGGRYWGTTATASNTVAHFRWTESGSGTSLYLSYSFTSTYPNYGGYCVRLVK